jgi:uncharacterized phage-like protein YoqJ
LEPKSCCFSGHRDIPEGELAALSAALDAEIAALAARGTESFYCGGALGFDTLAARSVIRAKAEFPSLRLVLAIPYEGMEKRWPLRDRIAYEEIMAAADSTVFLSEHYDKTCMLRRDRYMVDRSETCVCYLTQTTGGTAYTVNYALSCGIEVINLALKI